MIWSKHLHLQWKFKHKKFKTKFIYGYFLKNRTNVFRRPLLLRTAPFLWEQRKKRAGGKYRETSRTKRKRKSDCLFAPYIFELQDNLSYPSTFKRIKNPDFLLCATPKKQAFVIKVSKSQKRLRCSQFFEKTNEAHYPEHIY